MRSGQSQTMYETWKIAQTCLEAILESGMNLERDEYNYTNTFSPKSHMRKKKNMT